MSDRFYETDTDLEASEYDDEMASLMDGIESLDDEFFNPLDPIGIFSGRGPFGLFGGNRGSAQPRQVRPNVQQYPSRLPTPGPSIPNPWAQRMPATVEQVQAVAKVANTANEGVKLLNQRMGVVNNRINTLDRKVSAEVTRINAVNAAQAQAITRLNRTARTLREDLERSTQTTLMMTLLTSGKKDYEITQPATGAVNGGTTVTLKPSGGSMDLLLPILLMSGSSSGGKGGMFDNPLILVLLIQAMSDGK
jgi:hypothetical protein